MMKLLGEDGVAAVTVMIYVQFLLTALTIGFSMGVAPVISYHYGSGDEKQLRNIVYICFRSHILSEDLWMDHGPSADAAKGIPGHGGLACNPPGGAAHPWGDSPAGQAYHNRIKRPLRSLASTREGAAGVLHLIILRTSHR